MKWNLAFVFFLFIGLQSKANTINFPDTTTSLVDRGAAQLLISEGKKLYNEEDYRGALVKFREASIKDKNSSSAVFWISECHLMLKNYENALRYGLQAEKMNPEVHEELFYLIGVCYHKKGELGKAIEYFEKAIKVLTELKIKDLKIKIYIDQCNRAKEMMANPIKVSISALGVNVTSKGDEYAAVVTNNGKTLYYSARRSDNIGGGVSPGDRMFFSDIYISEWDEVNQEWGPSSNSNDIVKRLNSVGFDDMACISTDGEYLYLTVNTDGLIKANPKTKSGDIYFSKIGNDGTWTRPRPMPKKTINTIFFDAAPSLTADGNTMYFISERVGGKGKADIWMAKKVNKSTWGKPINLGGIINTPEQETTVFVTPDEKYLFFSSTGHEGIGGYDIFVSKNEDGIWQKPVNLGYPINTVLDDTHFQYYPNLGKAYYSKVMLSEDGFSTRNIFEVDITNLKLP